MTRARAGTARILAALMAGLALGPMTAGVGRAQDRDPLTAPIAVDLAPLWLKPQPPTRIHGQTYLVGFGGMNVALIRTQAGLILIDGSLPQAAPLIEDDISRLGLRIEDIRLILSSEPHYDHAGGLAALSRDSGAPVLTSSAGARVLRRGRSGMEDPQAPVLLAYPPVTHLKIIHDGQRIVLGETAVTAHLTPGHTPGSVSWTWRSCEPGDCVDIAFVTSLNSRTEGGWRFSDPIHRDALKAFRATFTKVRALPCDILLTGHPEHSDGEAKMKALLADPKSRAFRVPHACRNLADRYERALDERVAQETSPSKP
jgi:metallo-beta-lactamase class B